MPDTFTTNLNLTKPAVGGDNNTWGGLVNADMDAIDAIFNGDGSGTSVGINVGSGKTFKLGGTISAIASSVADFVLATLSVAASRFSIKDATDNTKIVKLDASGVATATTRTLAVPNASGEIVLKDATQTLTNKTLTSPTMTAPTLGTPASGNLSNCDHLPDGGLALIDVTTNNVSTTKHGFAPKAPNDATKFLDGTGAYSTPPYPSTVLRGYMAGLVISNNATTPNTKIDVAAGSCTDGSNSALITLAAGTIDCGTNGANGLDTGALANSTWYHVYAIRKSSDGTVSRIASTSASAPTYPSGYDQCRRIGSFKTDGSAHIIAFIQVGDTFRWVQPVLDGNNVSLSSTWTDLTLTVPTGVVVEAFGLARSSSIVVLYLRPKATSAGSTPTLPDEGGSNSDVSAYFRQITDSSAKIQWSSSSSLGGFYLQTHGWFDNRGKDA